MNILKKLSKHQISKIIFFIAGFIVVERFCHGITEGFRPHKILSDLPYNPKFATAHPSVKEFLQVQQLLSQPFHFLGSGGQCYAFLGEDNKTIVKVFKHHHMRPDSYLNRLPLPFFLNPIREKIVEERKERLQTIFMSVKLADTHFKENTGLIYAHLNKTDLFHQKLTLIDNIGIAHTFDIDSLTFALQEKAELALPKIQECMQNHDSAAAKRCIKSLIELIVARSRCGLGDRDPIMTRNFGFIGEKAVEIDLGSFYEDPLLKKPAAYKKELLYETAKLRSWIHKRYPELFDYLLAQLKEFYITE